MSRGTWLAMAIATRVVTDVPLLWMFVLLHVGFRGEGGAWNAVANGVAFAAWAVLHSLLARERGRRFLERLTGGDLVRVAYVAIAGLTLAALLAAWRPVSGELWHARGLAAWALTGAYAASLAALVAVTLAFDYPEFLGLRQARRRVTGRPSPPPVMTVKGAYAYCRHPMYLAMLAAFWVGPVMSVGRLEFGALATAYLLVGLRLEERNLRAELGPDYDVYRRNVPMLLPRLTPWRPDIEAP